MSPCFRVSSSSNSDRLALALASAALGHWEWDFRSGIQHWDALGLRHLGDAKAAYPLRNVLPDDRLQLLQAMDCARRDDSPLDAEFRVRGADGRVRWLQLRGGVHSKPDGTPIRMLGILTEITSRKKTEECRRFLTDASTRLSLALDTYSTEQAIYHLGKLGYESGTYCLLFEETPEGTPRFSLPPDLPRETAQGIHALRSDSEFVRWLSRSRDWKGSAVFPLRAREGRSRTIAFLCSQHPWDRPDLILAKELAHRFSIALENSRLVESLNHARQAAERSATQAALLQDITARLSKALSFGEVAETCVDACFHALSADRALLAVSAPGKGGIRMESARGYPLELLAELQACLEKTSGFHFRQSLERSMPVIIENIHEQADLLRQLFPRIPPAASRLLARSETRSFAIFPLRFGNRALGALIVSYLAPHRFAPDERNLMQLIVQQCAQALERSRLYEEARNDVLARDEFLSIASHELKTPITSLHLQLEMLRRRACGELSRLSECGLRQSRKLTVLIDELLDLTRIRLGRMELSRQATDLATICRELPNRFAAELEQSGSRLTVSGPECLTGRWDPARIEQVVMNLISNAIKYGEGKAIELRLSQDEKNASARIVVEDHGPGIPLEEQERIFERFERAVSFKYISGLGLGLYIVKQIVGAHFGKIELRSAPGQGSTFTITLPLSGEPPQAQFALALKPTESTALSIASGLVCSGR